MGSPVTLTSSGSVEYGPDVPLPMQDYWVGHAIREVESTYGDIVSVNAKKKSLIKFGKTLQANDGVRTTVGIFQDAVVNETLATGNTVDSLVSTSGSDTGIVTVEGHTMDGSGNLTFVSQDVTATGQTRAVLGTPMARANRMYIKGGTFAVPAVANVGNIAVYDNAANSGLTAGKPDTDASVKMILVAGINQTQKCATSISSTDYWFISEVYASVTRGSPQSAKVNIEVEYKQVGGVWRPLGFEMNLDQASGPHMHDEMRPFFIIPKNSDVRMIAISDTASTIVSGYIGGVLAKVTG